MRGFLLVVDRGLLAQRLWGLAEQFPELALELGHVGLVLELVQVVERLRGCMLRDALGTNAPSFERAVLVGAHCDQARHVRDEVLGYLGNRLQCRARFRCGNPMIERY